MRKCRKDTSDQGSNLLKLNLFLLQLIVDKFCLPLFTKPLCREIAYTCPNIFENIKRIFKNGHCTPLLWTRGPFQYKCDVLQQVQIFCGDNVFEKWFCLHKGYSYHGKLAKQHLYIEMAPCLNNVGIHMTNIRVSWQSYLHNGNPFTVKHWNSPGLT